MVAVIAARGKSRANRSLPRSWTAREQRLSAFPFPCPTSFYRHSDLSEAVSIENRQAGRIPSKGNSFPARSEIKFDRPSLKTKRAAIAGRP